MLRRRNETREALARLHELTGEVQKRTAALEGLLQRLHQSAIEIQTDTGGIDRRVAAVEHDVARADALNALATLLREQQAVLAMLLREQQAVLATIIDRTSSFEAAHVEVQASLRNVQELLADSEKSHATLRKRASDLKRRMEKQTIATVNASEAIASVERTIGAVATTIVSKSDIDKRFKRVRRQLRDEFRELRKLKSPMGAASDAAFRKNAQAVLAAGRTLLGYDRLFVLWQAARNAAAFQLPAAEVGTFRGGSAFFLASALEALGGRPAELHVVDTFSGHPEDKISSHDPDRHRGKFTDTSYEDVSAYLATFPDVHVYQGEASGVLQSWPERIYGLVHLDVDLYVPTAECLHYFGPRLAAGGIIVLDDYAAPNCPGVIKAVHEFIASAPIFHQWDTQTEQLVLVKRAAAPTPAMAVVD